jgi:hypothetical protein
MLNELRNIYKLLVITNTCLINIAIVTNANYFSFLRNEILIKK